jgi:hypothetical protein
MEQRSKYRLRVEMCIGTIIDVHKRIRFSFENEKLLSQFEQLRRAVNDMDMTQVCERDVVLVEQATNALLCEFKPVFENGGYGPVYESRSH